MSIKSIRWCHAISIAALCLASTTPTFAVQTIRFATFNTAMNRKKAGQLAQELESGNSQQGKKIAAIIQYVRPDVILLNEVDYDVDQRAATAFLTRYLGVDQANTKAITYGHQFSGPVNTGVPFEGDLDHDGRTGGPADCFGYGAFPGQYGMLVLSRFPIQLKQVRTFQKFLWKDMPEAKRPSYPKINQPFYRDETWSRLRLSSKSHWDVPIQLGDRMVHLLASHPTPPVFDGPEDRNGTRNHDEIRFWADYVSPTKANYIYDDEGTRGGLSVDKAFVIVGDLNADPTDGDSSGNPVKQLLRHPRIQSLAPRSRGASEKSLADGKANLKHRGDAACDTGDFADNRTGNLRIDYVLPSQNLKITDSGVFWPAKGEEGNNLVDASDHRMVWIDISLEPANEKTGDIK